MDYSYEEILERMSDKFYELSGYEADRVSDVGIRMRVLAGEIFSLTSELDQIKKQMFVTTASGDKLDLHAQMAGTERIKGEKAQGRIMFRLDVPLEYDIIIPKGTICTNSEGTLNYVTIEEQSIESGSNYAFVWCEAENSGKRYNVSPDTVTTIVTYFSVGISITNSMSFQGGTDDESDEKLRERIIELMRNKPNGINSQYYKTLAESVDGVYSACVVANSGGAGAVSIFIADRGKEVTEAVRTEVQTAADQNKSIGIYVFVNKASAVSVNVTLKISVKDGYSFSEVKTAAEEAVTEFFNTLSVNEDVTCASLGNAVYAVEGVKNYQLIGFQDTSIGYSEFASLGTLTVSSI